MKIKVKIKLQIVCLEGLYKACAIVTPSVHGQKNNNNKMEGVLPRLSLLSHVLVWIVKRVAPKEKAVRSVVYLSNRIKPDRALGPRPFTDETRSSPVTSQMSGSQEM